MGWARLADELGYESAWTTDGQARDWSVVLTAFAGATRRIQLGTAIVTIYPRHPAVMARQALALDEVSGGRFILGIGMGHRNSMEGALGYRMADPIAAMRAYTDVLRQAFATGNVSHHSAFWNVEWSYPLPRKREVTVMWAALNPPLMEAAGECADGVILWLATAEYVRDVVVPRVKASRQKVGKTREGFDIVAPIPVAVTEEVEQATKELRAGIARSASQPFYRREFINAGYREEMDAMQRLREEGGDPAQAISQRLTDALGAAGSPAEVRACIQRFRDAGANLSVVRPFYERATERTLREAIGA